MLGGMGREKSERCGLRAALCILVALVMVLTVLSSIQSPSSDREKRSAEIFANGSRTFNVGVVDYMGYVATLNPFAYTSSAEYETLAPCYSTLLVYDVNANLIGDLASSWNLAPDGLTWNFKLAQNAYFIDPASPSSTAHQVTAKDVIWTYWEVNNDTSNHLSTYFRNAGVGVLDKMWTGTNQWDLYVQTKTTYAPFIGALADIPIVPEYIWGHLPVGRTPMNYANLPPIGSGYLYYANGAVLPGQTGVLKRNPQWFQEANRGWQIHIDTLQFKNEMSAADAWAALTASPPLIDTYLNVARDLYVAYLANPTTPGVIGWGQSSGFIYEYQLNQLDPARRIQYENAGLIARGGTSNPLLLDPTVKLAMAMCVDKQAFINQVLQGLGSVADSLVPDCNPWHYTYPNPIQFNPSAARTLLNNAGWSYDSSGAYNPNGAAPLYRKGATNNTVYQPLSFRLLSLNQAAEWAIGSTLLAQWAALAGIKLNIYLYSVSNMNTAWYSANYDAWLWDWIFTPTSDPSTDCLNVDTTMEIGSWSGSYWHNASYDALYNMSLTAMDSGTRRQVTDTMQASIYEDHDDQLIAYAKSLFAANTYYWDRASYGNWAAHWTLAPDQGFPWLYMRLSPVDNIAPATLTSSPTYGGFVGRPITFNGVSVETTSVQYQWYWGDGTVSGWLSSAMTTHTYAKEGVYTAYFAARETGTADGFIGWNQTTVTVIGGNIPPVLGNPPIVMTPSNGINTATTVSFVGQANDPEDDPIYYTWDFGDTSVATGSVVTHQYVSAGNYTVKLTLTDNVAGHLPQVATQVVAVALNHPPQLSIHSNKTVLRHTLTTFTASASDLDGDLLRFTWVWGDGSTTVTSVPSATHSYSDFGSYSLVFCADDLTNLPGHNVTAMETAKVVNNPSPPTATISAIPISAWVGQTVTFTGSGTDPDGDAMFFNFTFGDGTYSIAPNGPTNPNEVVTDAITHTYASAGTMSARMAASDGLSTTQSAQIFVTVSLNHPPVVTQQVNKQAYAGSSVFFSATATDEDGETLRYTWDFGDGSPMQVGQSTTHVYVEGGMYNFTVYVDDLTGLVGHNVSSSATASIAFNLGLAVGWNFVSLPLSGYGYKASTLGLSMGDEVVDPSSPPYHIFIKGITPMSDDFPIKPSTGYWIWVAAAKTLHIYGSVPTTLQTKALVAGWNNVGFLGLNSRHASDIAAMYSGEGSAVLVAKYTGTGYITYIKGTPANNFLLGPGEACWIWTTGAGTLSYMP